MKKRVFCARDAFGIKPLYYSFENSNFYFASEVPGVFLLTEETKTLDRGSIINYLLRSSYDVAQHTMTSQVKSLKPGAYLSIDLSNELSFEEQRWWNPSIKENTKISFQEAAQKLRELFLINLGDEHLASYDFDHGTTA